MSACPHCSAPLFGGAHFCAACGAPVEPTPTTEERKLATVLFADLVGSTALAGSLDPERTRAILDRFYDAMAAEIAAAGGTVEKFVGDAVVAAFGVPSAQEDHAERALHAALSMHRRLRALFGAELALRVGVNTGEVVVGRPREGSSFVTGDAVNIAARLEQGAQPGEVLVGERTAAAARGAFEFDSPLTIEAKGKESGLQAHRLVRALSLVRPRGVGGLRRTFVGREAELELLQATYHRVVGQAQPHLVTVLGESGVGKTRLVHELWQRLGTESPEPLCRSGRCLPYGRGITYWPLGEILKEHLGILESDAPETVRERLGPREILGLTLGLDVGEELHPLTARERLYEAWCAYLEELASERPTVVLLEDLHWAEEPLLDLLDGFARDVRGPLMVIATGRPELLDRHAAWGRGSRNTSLLWLEPLSDEDAGRLLDELLDESVPTRLRALVMRRAEGNPFFVEELVSTLIDRNVLEHRDGVWTAHELTSEFEVPDSVHATLAARIDVLAPAEKAALQAASVIGRVFWPGPVVQMLGGGEPDFRVLEERDFIRRRSGSTMDGEREYAIKNELTRDVAYASLPKARRARLHAAFAACLEQIGVGRDEHAPLLAHHYAEAVRPEDVDLAWGGEEAAVGRLRRRAVEWLRRAAELAERRYEIDEALALLYRALEFEENNEALCEIWRAIGHASALKFDGESFVAAMERALTLSGEPEIGAEVFSELALQTVFRSGMWRRQPDSDLVEGWIEEALRLAQPETAAQAKALSARACWAARRTGSEATRSAESAVEATALAERLDDVELSSFAFLARSLVTLVEGRYQESCEWTDRRLALLERINDPDHRAEAHWAALFPYAGDGRFREARRLAAKHEAIASRLTPHHRLHGIGYALWIEELMGSWNTIVELAPRAERRVAENETPCPQGPRSLLVCALANAHLRNEQAARRLEKCADDLGMEGYALVLGPLRIRLALVRGQLAVVERLLVETIPREELDLGLFTALTARLDALVALRDRQRVEAEAPPLVLPRTYVEPFALRALGVLREEETLIAEAAARFAAMELDWHAGETRRLLTEA